MIHHKIKPCMMITFNLNKYKFNIYCNNFNIIHDILTIHQIIIDLYRYTFTDHSLCKYLFKNINILKFF